MTPLKFNGNPLPSGVGITALTVSTPDIDFRTVDVPDKRGEIRAAKKMGKRVIQITLALLGDSVAENVNILRELNDWCYSYEPAPLYLPSCPNHYINAECDTFPPYDLAKLGGECQIAFSAHDPAFLKSQRSYASCNGSAFRVDTKLDVYPTIEQTITETITNAGWVIDTNKSITINGDIEAGLLVIDCEKEAVTLDGVDITDQVTLASTLGFKLTRGQHTVITYNGAGGYIYWRDALLYPVAEA